jgi:hypothetical protein
LQRFIQRKSQSCEELAHSVGQLAKAVKNESLDESNFENWGIFFLGVKVCALAFMQLTGVSAGTLHIFQESRDNVIRPSGKILGSWMGVAANSKPNRYLEC